MEGYTDTIQAKAQKLFELLQNAPIGAITNIYELPWLPFLKQGRQGEFPDIPFFKREVDSESERDYELLQVEECLNEIVEKDGRFILDYSVCEGTEMEFEDYGKDFLLLKNNRKKQDASARKFAKKEDIYDVSFAFYWNHLFYYNILHDPSICVELRYPIVYIVVEQDLHVRYSTDEESVAHERDIELMGTRYSWGCRIYRYYEGKVKCGEASEYEREIVAICDTDYPKYDSTMPKPMMYRALEEAAALNMKVDIVPDVEFQQGGINEGRCDGWSYHPEVK